MDHAFIKFSAAFVLGGALLASPAYALSPLSLNGGPSFVVPVADEEDEEIMRDMRPDEMPQDAEEGKEEGAHEAGKESDSGDVEEETLYRDLETGVTPPPGE